MIAGSIEIQLLANLARLQQDMDKANRLVGNTMTSISRSADMAKKALATIGVGFSLGLVVSGIKSVVRAAEEARQVQVRLNAVYKATGGVVGLTSDELNKLADSMAAVTQFDDESIRDGMAEIIKFGTITGKVFKDSLKVIADYAAFSKQGFSEAAAQVGKALGDTEHASKLLKNAGVILTDQEKELIEALNESGRAAEAQQIILEKLNATYGGTAELLNTGLTKSITDLGKAWDELFETMGGSITQTNGTAVAFQNIAGYLQNMKMIVESGDWLDKLKFFGTFGLLTDRMQNFKDTGRFPNEQSGQIRNSAGLTQAEARAIAAEKARSESAIAETARKKREESAKVDKAFAEKQRQEKIRDIQDVIDFETEQTEVRNKMQLEEEEKKQKIMLDYYARTNEQIVEDIEKRNQIEQDYFERTNREIMRGLEERGREAKRLAESLESSLTDAILRGFESGKGFGENFKDTLVNMFKTMVLKPTISAIVSPVAGAVGAAFSGGAMAGDGAAGGSSGGFGGMLSTGKSLLEGISNGFDSLNASFVGSIEGLSGDLISMGFDKLGGFMFENSAIIADVLPYAGAALQLLSGDVKGAAFTAVGTAIGSFFGPVGGMIGGALGSMVGGLFGGSGEKYKQMGEARSGMFQNGKFSSSQNKFEGDQINGVASGMDAINKQFSKNLSSILKEFGLNSDVYTASNIRLRRTSGKLATHFSAGTEGGHVSFGGKAGQFGGDGDIEAGFSQFSAAVLGKYLVAAIQASKLPKAVRDLFNGMTDGTQVAGMINGVMSLNRSMLGLNTTFGLTTEQAAQVALASAEGGEALLTFITNLAALGNALKTPGQAILELKGTLTDSISGINGNGLPATVRQFDLMLKAVDKTNQAGIETFSALFALRESFIQMTQAVDGLKTGVRGAIFNMSSDTEQYAMLQRDLAVMFGELNMAVPVSIDQLINLGKSIDYTTEEGLNLAAVFPSLVQAFMTTEDAANSLVNTMSQLDSKRFRTLVDYTRAVSYTRNGISLDRLPAANMPSYDIGTNFVPNDGQAMIHRGERIFTAVDNREIVESMRAGGSSDLIAEVRALRGEVADMKKDMRITAESTKRTKDVLDASVSGQGALTVREAA
jgi:hypothetical protein